MNTPDGLPLYRIAFIGSYAVGKTALIERFVDDFFSRGFRSAINFDFRSHIIELAGKAVKLQLVSRFLIAYPIVFFVSFHRKLSYPTTSYEDVFNELGDVL
jgi:hypothetical protein